MHKKFVYIIALLSLLLIILLMYSLNLFRITGFFVGFGPPAGEFEWWNVSWHYRFRLEINSTSYSRTDWPIEQRINFTDLLPSGTFDENSTRVFEYSPSGSILYEVKSQFDKDDSFDASSNALGTLVFLMNGTTQPNTKRIFYVYYDTVENGAKEKPVYDTSLSYGWDGKEFNVNNSVLAFWVDTVRGENTSGLIRVKGLASGNDIFIWPLASNARTYEYMQYSNGTYNFSFDFRNNASFKHVGPVRIVVEQKGNETVWNSTNTTEGFAVKRYIFYDKPEAPGNQWIKIETEFTNMGSDTITRNSTFAGALAIDALRAFGANWQSSFGNSSEPGWWFASDQFGSFHAGIILVNQTGTNNYWVPNSSSKDRIGIQLNSTSIQAGSSIAATAIIHFNDTSGDYTQVRDLRDRIAFPVSINQTLPERWYVIISPSTNATIYNRNESILITGNVSNGDPYNLTEYMNATLDMGTPSESDDQTIVLYDDGTHGDEVANDKTFTNFFELANDASVGTWTINFSAYSNNSEFLNSTALSFNVTDVLNVTVNIQNKKPMVGSIVFASISVKNYRQDSWIAGAEINCSYDSNTVTNKTDYNNGTYSVNFTAPSEEGVYILYCNATKNGNLGSDTDNFTAEPAKTYINITAEPSNPFVTNVTFYENDSFVITANVTNVGNGTAYSTNISLELLSGWDANKTLEECGELEKNTYCIKGFNITVPNGTQPGNYFINVTATWRNPDQSLSTNKTMINVTVEPNPLIEVEQTKVFGEAGDGIWTIVGNFTVSSIGNYQLSNISFSCASGDVCSFAVEFIPENISSLPTGSSQNVSLNVTVPLAYIPGTYNGTINVSAQNDNFDTFTLEVIVPAKTNVSISVNPESYTAYNITQQDNESFSFSSYAKNIGNGSARLVNISLILPNGWTSNSSLEYCNNLLKDESCSKGFNVTIASGTQPGNYFVNVSVNWTQPDGSMGTNKTSLNVSVASNPLINVSEIKVSGSVPDGTEETLGNFTVLSIGNDALQNIGFNCFSGVVCQDFTVEFIPSSISSLPVNSNQSVMVNVSVPLSYAAGTYNGSVNVSSSNDKYKNLTLEVTVPPNRTWSMQPEYCERSESPPEGLACEINVTNEGNIIINFTVSPEEGNYTKVSETNFSVDAQSYHIFSVTYNVTNVPPGIYNSTFLVDALQPDSNPDNKTLKVSLVPYVEPIIEINITPNETEQFGYVEIFVNVTDRSGTGMAWAKANITRPNGTLDEFDMTKTYESGNLTSWYLKYPDDSGSTSLRGKYNVSIYAKDNVGNVGVKNSTFLIYIKLSVTLSTLSSKYYQGDTGSIYYIIRDANGLGVSGANVSFEIKDSNQNTTYQASYSSNQDGMVSPLPSFSLSSDAPLGIYNLISNSTYFDDVANKTVQTIKNSSFQVLSRTVTVTGLFADLETAVVWYPDNIMKFGILVYNGEGKPVDPTSMNLTVYDPAGNLYFTALMAQMTKQATGFYTYSYAMPGTTPTGMFLAVLNVTQEEFQTMKLKAFRVARGGPYDLFLQLLEYEVQQGDYLDFLITIDNKGEVSQDVNLYWWVTSENETYYSDSGWVYTPAHSNQSITKQAYIFSNQPLGTAVLNVKMVYDSVQPPLTANATFVVLSKIALPNITYPNVTYPITIIYYYAPYAPIPTPKVVERLPADISIVKYSSNVSVVRGMTQIESVIVKNTGQVDLSNVSIFILGIPTSWFNITPDVRNILPPENSTVFLISYNIPKNAAPGEYRISLTAVSGVVSDQKYVTLTIFESMEELLQDEINKLKIELEALEIDIGKAEKEGKDVRSVRLYVDEIRSQIGLAEENLRNNRTEDALLNVETAKSLLGKARELLSRLEVPRIEVFFIIPLWLILLIIALIISISIAVILLKRRKMLPRIKPFIPLEKVVEKKEVKEDLVKERERLLRMLEVLEKEKSEGIISNVAYAEMKKSIEAKLEKIEKKIK